MTQLKHKFSWIIICLVSTLAFSETAYAVCNLYLDLEAKIPLNDPNRIACLSQANFLLPRPERKTLEEVIAGPKTSDPAIQVGDTVYCRYFYRFQNGSSNKFRCYRTDEKNNLMNDKGKVVLEAVSVATIDFGGKLEEDVLLGSDGKALMTKAKDGSLKLQQADVLKVRFKHSLEGEPAMSPLSEWRHREAFTSSVASRLAWMMGIPSESYYPTKQVVCFGCDSDPWKDGANPQLAPLNKTNIFPFASIERKFEGKRIIKAFTSNPKLGKTFVNVPWTWYEYMSHFKKLNSQQQHEIQVLALFIGLMHTVEERGSQHVLLCEKEKLNQSKSECLQPLAGTHDLGSAFGNRAGAFVKNGNHPRGNFAAYKALNMFRDNDCTLTAQPGRPANVKGDGMLKKVSETARREFLERLELVSRDDLQMILRISNFQDVDLPFKAEVAKKSGLSGEQLTEKVLELWTDLIFSKMDQFRNVTCPVQPVIE